MRTPLRRSLAPTARTRIVTRFIAPIIVATIAALPFLNTAGAQDSTHTGAGKAQSLAPVTTQAESPPTKAEDAYFFTAPDGGVYIRRGHTGPTQLLFQPGMAFTFAPSRDGQYVAYGVASTRQTFQGAPVYQVRIRDVNRNQDINEVIDNAVISSTPWTRNNKGFFYAKLDTAEHRERVYYHLIGDPPARDQIVLSRLDYPDWTYDVRVSDDGRFAVMTVAHPQDTNNRLFFIDLDNPKKPVVNAPVVKLVDAFSGRYRFIDNAGSTFFLLTNSEAPHQRIVMASTIDLREGRWTPVIKESADSLVGAYTAGDVYLITVSRSSDNKTVARVYTPPSKKEMQEEMRKRMDSTQRARGGGRRPMTPRPPSGGMNGMDHPDRRSMGGTDFGFFRLNLKREIPIPAGSSIIAMRSNAEDEELFYIAQLPDGSTRTYIYNVKHDTNEPFDTNPGQLAGRH